jgi:CRISPR-associated protein Cst1
MTENMKREIGVGRERMGKKMDEAIKIYPSNWLYNAGVIGFFKTVAHSCGESVVENWLLSDGTVKIDKKIFENVKLYNKELPKCLKYYTEYLVNDSDAKEWLSKTDKQGKNYKEKYKDNKEQLGLGDFGYKFIQAGNKLFASKTPYQNLVQLREWNSLEFATFIGKLRDYPKIKSEVACALCGNNKVLKANPDSKLESRLFIFQEPHMRLLAPSTGEFPNAFWNLNDSFSICPLCAYLIIHHHIPFENAKTQGGQIFINAPSFKVMWHLNKYASQILSRRNNYQLREILGISFMELSQKVFTTLGAWSMMNIEMVVKGYNRATKQTEIDYYSLPYETSRLLLNKGIASLISQTKEDFILEIVLKGNFDSLLILNQKILRYAMTNTSASTDNYFSKLKNKKTQSLKNLSMILPELYVKINSILKEG